MKFLRKNINRTWFDIHYSKFFVNPYLRIMNNKLRTRKRTAAAAAKSLQSSPTLCDPGDGSPPGSPVPGILQARTLEWVAISFSNAWKWKVKVKLLSHVQLLATPWTAAHKAPPSMGFSKQEYWSGVPLPSPRKGDWLALKALEYKRKLKKWNMNTRNSSPKYTNSPCHSVSKNSYTTRKKWDKVWMRTECSNDRIKTE